MMDEEYIECKMCGDEIPCKDTKNRLCIECQCEIGRQNPHTEEPDE
jgi:hypothetical protein